MQSWSAQWSGGRLARTAAVAVVAMLSLVLVQTGSTISTLVNTATLIVLAIVLVSGERRHDAIRRSRFLLLGALICAFTSGLMAGVYELITNELPPRPWLGDAVSLSYVPFTVAGMLLIPAGSLRTGHRARAAADGLLAASSLWFLFIAISGSTHVPGVAGAGLAAFVSYAYPVGDVFVVATGLTVLARCAAPTTRTVAWMVTGLSVVASTDIWQFISGLLQPDRGSAVLYQAGLLLLVGGASGPAIPRDAPMTWRPILGSALEMFPFIPLLACIAVTGERALDGKGMPPAMMLPAVAVASALIVRQFAGARDRQRLVDQLEVRRTELEAALRRDDLTGLANRLGLTEAMNAALADPEQWPVTLVLVDLNGFKLINDNHGHATGDDVLRTLGRRLSSRLRNADTIARLGGDEFAVLACRVRDPRRAGVIDRLVECFDDPISIGERTFTVHASIGVVTGQSPETAGQLLAHADAAMYRTKSARLAHTSVTVLDPASRADIARQLRINEDIAHPELRDFRVLYQPVVDLATGQIRGLEALLRWEHPTLGLISPTVFVPLAEQAGSITTLGAFALATAARDFAWLCANHERPGFTMAVNVSPRQLTRPGFVEFALATIRSTGLRPEQLTFEVTEQAFEANLEAAGKTVAELRAAGADVAVDDFGTGYSSLRYLQELDLTVMKIDKLFVSEIAQPRTRQLVRSVVDMAAGLGLHVIAEGIASIDQLRELQQLNCELGQGFLFSPPMSAGAVDALLAAGHTYPVGLGEAAPIVPAPRRGDPTPVVEL